MHVGKAHELNNKIEKAIKEKIEGITDIAIHIEPYNKNEKNLED
jgi:divalent metal cation (Fe/Co/Zn/Cd) transporter